MKCSNPKSVEKLSALLLVANVLVESGTRLPLGRHSALVIPNSNADLAVLNANAGRSVPRLQNDAANKPTVAASSSSSSSKSDFLDVSPGNLSVASQSELVKKPQGDVPSQTALEELRKDVAAEHSKTRHFGEKFLRTIHAVGFNLQNQIEDRSFDMDLTNPQQSVSLLSYWLSIGGFCVAPNSGALEEQRIMVHPSKAENYTYCDHREQKVIVTQQFSNQVFNNFIVHDDSKATVALGKMHLSLRGVEIMYVSVKHPNEKNHLFLPYSPRSLQAPNALVLENWPTNRQPKQDVTIGWTDWLAKFCEDVGASKFTVEEKKQVSYLLMSYLNQTVSGGFNYFTSYKCIVPPESEIFPDGNLTISFDPCSAELDGQAALVVQQGVRVRHVFPANLAFTKADSVEGVSNCWKCFCMRMVPVVLAVSVGSAGAYMWWNGPKLGPKKVTQVSLNKGTLKKADQVSHSHQKKK